MVKAAHLIPRCLCEMVILCYYWVAFSFCQAAPIHADVVALNGEDVGDVDIVTSGSPCPGFSNAGHGLGNCDGRSQLVFESFRVADEVNADHVFLDHDVASQACGRNYRQLVGLLQSSAVNVQE